MAPSRRPMLAKSVTAHSIGRRRGRGRGGARQTISANTISEGLRLAMEAASEPGRRTRRGRGRGATRGRPRKQRRGNITAMTEPMSEETSRPSGSDSERMSLDRGGSESDLRSASESEEMTDNEAVLASESGVECSDRSNSNDHMRSHCGSGSDKSRTDSCRGGWSWIDAVNESKRLQVQERRKEDAAAASPVLGRHTDSRPDSPDYWKCTSIRQSPSYDDIEEIQRDVGNAESGPEPFRSYSPSPLSSSDAETKENVRPEVEKRDRNMLGQNEELSPQGLMDVVRSLVPTMPAELMSHLEGVLHKECPLADMVRSVASLQRQQKITRYFQKANRPTIQTTKEDITNNVNEPKIDSAMCIETRDITKPTESGTTTLGESCDGEKRALQERPSWDVASTSRQELTMDVVSVDSEGECSSESSRVPTPTEDDEDIEALFPSVTMPSKQSTPTGVAGGLTQRAGSGGGRGAGGARRRGRARRTCYSDEEPDDSLAAAYNELLTPSAPRSPVSTPAARVPAPLKIRNEGEQEVEEMGVAETYADYKPAKLPYGSPHPDCVVETASLSSVDAADVTYQLSLPGDTITRGKLSALQLEAVVYASQAHQHTLRDGNRAGFLIGDGAGVGKGRTIAGIIFENYLKGRKRAVWVSVSNDLKYDAERDLRDIGAGNIQVHALNKMSYSGIPVRAGVVFSTFSALIGKTSARGAHCTRLGQLLAWCGAHFDGCIVFDECHRAKNLCPPAGTKPTKTGLAVLGLQRALPRARVVYASATGASEPRNMAYMVRLGIWGEGTPFLTFKDFLHAVEKRGVGAMEIVAMDMKLRGMYIARQLSFHGVTFKIEEVPLSAAFRDTYDKAVELWVEARKLFDEAVSLVNASQKWRMVMWAQFWGGHQRFFKYLCIAAKVERTVQRSKEAVAAGRCVVIGLQATGEARTLDQLERDQGRLTDFICTAKGVFNSLVEKQFPCPHNMTKPEDYADKLPSLVVSEQTNAMREKLLKDIRALGVHLPPNTLDQLLDELGGAGKVAEMTGRKGRVVQTLEGKIQYESRSEADVPLETLNLTEKQRFMDGEKDVAIISEAASSGISLQSDRRAINQKRRVHITLELPWSADRAIQQFGRTHRSNQVNAPEYIFLISDLAGERRFASTVAKRLESLGALTHGDRRATETRDLSQFNIDNKYGREALRRMVRAVFGRAAPLVPAPQHYRGEFLKDAAAALADVGVDVSSEDNSPNIPRFLNRLLGVKVQLQNALFQHFSDTFEAIVQEAKRNGRFDMGILDLGAAGQVVRRVARSRFLREHATGQAPVELHTLHLERGFEWEKALKKYEERSETDPHEGFYLSRTRFNNNFNPILCIAHSATRDLAGRNRLFNIYRPNLGLQMRPELLSDIMNKYMKSHPAEVGAAWRAHYEHSLTTCTHAWWHGSCGNIGCEVGVRTRTYYVLSGSVLAVWAQIEAVYKQLGFVNKMQVVRVRTDHGLKIVGTLIPKYCVEMLKEELRSGALSVIED